MFSIEDILSIYDLPFIDAASSRDRINMLVLVTSDHCCSVSL